MNRLFYCILELVFITASLHSQTVTNKQFLIISKVTADWCPKCGDYGWSMFKDLEKEYNGKDVLVLAIHKSSSGIKTKSSEAIADVLGGTGQPLYFINDAEKEGINFDNWKTKLSELKEDVSLLSTNSTAFIGVNTALEQKANGKYKIRIKVKSFDQINNGEFYAAVYLVNDNLIAPQASQSGQAKHTGVLRENLLGEDQPFGVKMLTAPFNSGTEGSFEKDDVEIKAGTQSLKDFRIVTVLWNKRADKYVFNNAAVSELSSLLSNNEAFESDNFELRYDFNLKKVEITDTKGKLSEADIQMFNAEGKLLPVVNSEKQQSSLKLNLNEIQSGTYFIRVTSENRIFTKTLIVP
jgi:hypothetical protein